MTRSAPGGAVAVVTSGALMRTRKYTPVASTIQ